MSSESAMHKRNTESSILFMQQEHALILKGLHEEIARLQKRCTDLTFQLTMHGLTIEDDSGSVDNKMQQVHQDLEDSRSRIGQLEKELGERDKRVERLETEARAQRKRWLDESRAQSQAMNTLKAELEAKANNIAYLTTELHRLKQRAREQNVAAPVVVHQGGGEEGAEALGKPEPGLTSQPGYLNATESGNAKRHPAHPQHFMPAPPQREKSTLMPGSAAASSSRMRRSGGHSRSLAGSSVGVAQGKVIQGTHPASADAHLMRQHHNGASGTTTTQTKAGVVTVNPNHPLRLSSGRSSGSESPDITPFLPPKEESVVHGKQAPVLPPIPVSGMHFPGGQGPAGLVPAPPPQVLVHKVVSSGSQHRQLKASGPATTAPITKLAVENAAASKSDSAWALAQESRGSEYN